MNIPQSTFGNQLERIDRRVKQNADRISVPARDDLILKIHTTGNKLGVERMEILNSLVKKADVQCKHLPSNVDEFN